MKNKGIPLFLTLDYGRMLNIIWKVRDYNGGKKGLF